MGIRVYKGMDIHWLYYTDISYIYIVMMIVHHSDRSRHWLCWCWCGWAGCSTLGALQTSPPSAVHHWSHRWSAPARQSWRRPGSAVGAVGGFGRLVGGFPQVASAVVSQWRKAHTQVTNITWTSRKKIIYQLVCRDFPQSGGIYKS